MNTYIFLLITGVSLIDQFYPSNNSFMQSQSLYTTVFFIRNNLKNNMIKKIDMNLIFSTQPQTPERGNLYLGGVSVFNDMQVFKQKNIDCILTILDDWAYPKFKVKQKIEHAQITTSQRIKLQDDQLSTVFPQFKNSYEYIKINLQKTNVFVHCQMGVSRSSAIVIAFLMKEKDMSREDARVYVKERRKNISPNDKFWKELQVWEEHLKKPEL